MKGGMAINDNAGNDIIQMAKTKRHIHLLEKVHKGKPLSKKELEELNEFETKNTKSKKPSKIPPGVADTIPKLAKELKVSSRTVRNWIHEGMPVRADKTYHIESIRKWRKERDNRRKKKSKKADDVVTKTKNVKLQIAELDLRQRMGELISLEEVEKGRTARVLAVKQELLAIPKAMAKVLEHLEARQIESLLKDKVDQVIKKFSGQEYGKN